ncbi:hypothetical protein KL864_34015 [Mycolicibacterium goodii]|uniref:hypothetical protein n=1 Tax=Mycolicibacterium goodii TaxID=134601 RepID=UPI001BDCB44A|nr:hypothetical protein [Mycolicibacterium goodii]MBU8820884.1 hypothetical protein [Mycolicibacterium goodii]
MTITLVRVATHSGASDATTDDEWLSADDIAALSNGRATANTVRGWWRNGHLHYTVFPELGTKSNKRTSRRDAEEFLARKYGRSQSSDPPTATAAPRPPALPDTAAVADLIDTLSSVKAAADAALEGLVAEAEAHAAITRAMAESDAKRVETLKHLQTMLRGYDLALSTHIQPRSPSTAPEETLFPPK